MVVLLAPLCEELHFCKDGSCRNGDFCKMVLVGMGEPGVGEWEPAVGRFLSRFSERSDFLGEQFMRHSSERTQHCDAQRTVVGLLVWLCSGMI